ncbi:hypothetical protein WMY93_000076 [Mugilogobius chulae]|uniref:Uncharacterized protein n=1 Tax=Mugilogobius chulae TaxID=88201 RepID=A0AAW0PZ94_9GOBI
MRRWTERLRFCRGGGCLFKVKLNLSDLSAVSNTQRITSSQAPKAAEPKIEVQEQDAGVRRRSKTQEQNARPRGRIEEQDEDAGSRPKFKAQDQGAERRCQIEEQDRSAKSRRKIKVQDQD